MSHCQAATDTAATNPDTGPQQADEKSSATAVQRKGLVITNLFPNAVEKTRGIFVFQETCALLDHYDLRIIAPLPWVPPFLRGQPKFAHHAAPAQEQVQGLKVNHPRHLVIPRMLRWTYGALLLHAIRRLFDRLRESHPPQFVLAHYAYPDGWAALQLTRPCGIPLLVKVRGSDVNVFTAEPRRRALTMEALEGADRVVAVSHALKAKMIELGLPAECITVVRNGIDTERFRPLDRHTCRAELGLPAEPFTFLFIGTMREIKGVFPLLDAFRALRDAGNPARLEMIGSGELSGAVAERITELKLGDCVTLRPPVSHTDVPRWIGACDCLLLPSLMEGYPNVLVEALACARPVIASRVGGIPEIVVEDRTGLIVPPGEPQPLCAAMQRMTEGFELNAREAAAAQRSWDDVADDMSALIEDMIAERDTQT